MKPKQKDHEKFFIDHSVPFNTPFPFDSDIRKMWNGPNIPLIMFSHPHGLAKRLSIGTLPNDIKTDPVIHIEHTLGSCPGSSGGNLLICPIDVTNFTSWSSAFLHWGHIPDSYKLAIGWQAIDPCIQSGISAYMRAKIQQTKIAVTKI